MINTLDDEDVSFYLHIDKKSDISNKIIKKENVFILDESKCLDIKWGQNQMIHATTNLLKEAFYLFDLDFYDIKLKMLSSYTF